MFEVVKSAPETIMRWTAGLLIVSGLLLPGCNVAYYTAHNVINEPKLETGEHALRKRMRKAGQAAWAVEQGRATNCTCPDDYGEGFVAGYADYMVDGGPARAPVVPPPEYRRKVDAFTPQGQVRQQQYLLGFKHGAEVAAAQGGRESTLVTLAIVEPPPEPPLSINCNDQPPSAPTSTPAPKKAPSDSPMSPPMPPATPTGRPEAPAEEAAKKLPAIPLPPTPMIPQAPVIPPAAVIPPAPSAVPVPANPPAATSPMAPMTPMAPPSPDGPSANTWSTVSPLLAASFWGTQR